MTLLLRLLFCLSLLAALPLTAAAQLEELGEAGESDFNPLNPKPNYRGAAVGWEKSLPPDSTRLRYSVFLIGDVGSPISAGRGGEPSLNFMRREMLQAGRNSATIFLGDNIYNQGMPPEEAYDRKTAESRLNEQLDILKGYQGEKYMTPGNHDWIQGYQGGLAQVVREQVYAEHYLAQDSAEFSYTGDFMVPRNGCPGPYEIRLRDDLVMIALNSQWFITEQQNRPYGDACGADTEDEVYAQLEEVIKRNKDRHILIIAHHPLYSDGIHGGYFTFADHVFPLSIVAKYAFLPLPGIGSIYPLARKYGGISQDLAYPAYQNYKKNLLAIFAKYPNVIYANGHEHNLQYFEDEGARAHFITSGSGCKTQHVKDGPGGGALFSDKEKGFARLNYYDDGQVWVEYVIPNDSDHGQHRPPGLPPARVRGAGPRPGHRQNRRPRRAHQPPAARPRPGAGHPRPRRPGPDPQGQPKQGCPGPRRLAGRPHRRRRLAAARPPRRRARGNLPGKAARLPRQHGDRGREPEL